MNKRKPRYHRHRFPPEIISYAVWLYYRFSMSFRDVEDLLAERGVIVSYESIRRWCLKFGPQYRRSLKRREGRLGLVRYRHDHDLHRQHGVRIPFIALINGMIVIMMSGMIAIAAAGRDLNIRPFRIELFFRSMAS